MAEQKKPKLEKIDSAYILGPRAQKLLSFLKKSIKGQDELLERLVKTIDLTDSGLQRQDKPCHVALLVGTPRCGKKYLVQSIAKFYFGNLDAFIQISCFRLEAYLSRLTKNGINRDIVKFLCEKDQRFKDLIDDYQKLIDQYNETARSLQKMDGENITGQQEKCECGDEGLCGDKCSSGNKGGQQKSPLEKKLSELEEEINKKVKVTDLIISKSKNIILFEHVEDCTIEDLILLSGTLKNGKFANANGEVVSLNNSLIFLTCSNIVGSFRDREREKTERKSQRMGIKFEVGEESKEDKEDSVDEEKTYFQVFEDLARYFPSCFVSSIDREYVFKTYKREALLKILDQEIELFREELIRNLGFVVTLDVQDEVKKFIAEKTAKEPQFSIFGIKYLKHKFDKCIRRPFGHLKNQNKLKENDKIVVRFENGRIVLYRMK